MRRLFTPTRRRVTAIALAMLVGAATLAGCSNTRSDDTLLVWTPNVSTVDMAAQNKIAQAFEKENPGIDVQFVPKAGSGGSDATAVIAAVRGKTPPDVYVIDRFTSAQQASVGLLTDLQPFIEEDIRNGEGDIAEQYLPFARQESTYEGHMYSLPLDTDVRGLYYNKKVLRDAGVDPAILDPSNGPITIDEMWRIARKIDQKDAKGNYTRLGIIPWDGEASPATWGLIRGAKYYDEERCEFTPDEPAFRRTFEDLARWAKELDFQRVATFLATYRPPNQDPSQSPFYTGRLGMAITGNWDLSNIRKYAPDLDYGVTYLPVPEKGADPVTWSGGFALAIPSGVRNPELSWKFAKFMSGEVGQRIYARDTNRLPTWKALTTDASITNDQGIFPRMLKYATNRPPMPIGAQIWDAMDAAKSGVTLGELTPEEAVRQIYDRAGPKMKQFCPYKIADAK